MHSQVGPTGFLFSVLLGFAYSDVLGTTPDNTAVVSGESFSLKCIRKGSQDMAITWQNDMYSYVAVNGNVEDGYSVNYNGSEGFSQLTVEDTDMTFGGEYHCRVGHLNGENRVNGYCQVIILEKSIPDCTHDPKYVIVEDEDVSFSCSINYDGKWAPVMSWYFNGNEITERVTNVTTDSSVTYSLVLTAVEAMKDEPVSCDTEFNQPNYQPPTEHATNIPDCPVNTWTSDTSDVHMPVNEARILFDQEEGDLHKDTVITCSADVNPPADEIRWFDDTGNVVSDTPNVVVGPPGSYVYLCQVGHYVGRHGSQTWTNATKSFSFQSITTSPEKGGLTSGEIAGIVVSCLLLTTLIAVLVRLIVVEKRLSKLGQSSQKTRENGLSTFDIQPRIVDQSYPDRVMSYNNRDDGTASTQDEPYEEIVPSVTNMSHTGHDSHYLNPVTKDYYNVVTP